MPHGQEDESDVNRTLHDYRAYGLWVRSSIALPFTPIPTPSGAPDVTVHIGEIPDTLPAPADGGDEALRREAAPRPLERKIPGLARYLVAGGRDIFVEPLGGSDHHIGVFLTGLIFAALLRQRNVIAFHASAVETDMGAVLFAGRSGSGKSSLLAAFVDRGYAMLADDVTGVRLDANRPVVLSAFPCMRLWTDTLDQMGWQRRKRVKVHEEAEKYLVREARFRAGPLAVGAVCVLESHSPSEGIEVETVSTDDALRQLWAYTYRNRSLRELGQPSVYLRTIAALAKRVPVVRVTRPAHPFRLDALANRIEESLRATGTTPGAGVSS